jgi:hypothetical protein
MIFWVINYLIWTNSDEHIIELSGPFIGQKARYESLLGNCTRVLPLEEGESSSREGQQRLIDHLNRSQELFPGPNDQDLTLNWSDKKV